MVPYLIKFLSFSKHVGEDSFGDLFDSNDTQICPNLERKSGNSDFIYDKGIKLVLKLFNCTKRARPIFPKNL
jgi:hypothetical protein